MGLSALLVNRCTLERWATRTADANYTLQTPGFASVSTGVPFNLQEKSGRWTPSPHGEELTFDAVGYFSPGLDIRPDPASSRQMDRIVLTSPDTGAVYYVLAVLDQVGRQKLKKVLLRRE